MKKQNRREFLKTSALGTSMLLMSGCLESAQQRHVRNRPSWARLLPQMLKPYG